MPGSGTSRLATGVPAQMPGQGVVLHAYFCTTSVVVVVQLEELRRTR